MAIKRYKSTNTPTTATPRNSGRIGGGTASMRQKFTRMSRVWLGWGLRFQSGPTIRMGLATIIVASDSISTFTSTHAHALLEEFISEFRCIRNVHTGVPTFKNSPSQPSAFVVLHPDRLEGYVDRRVGVDLIREAATKEHIPIKVSNKKLTSKQSPTPAASSAASPHKMLEGLFQSLMGSRSPSNSPPPIVVLNQDQMASNVPIRNRSNRQLRPQTLLSVTQVRIRSSRRVKVGHRRSRRTMLARKKRHATNT